MFEKDFSATPLNFVYVNVRGEELDQYSAILTRFYSVRRTTKKDEKKSNKMLEEGKSLNKKKFDGNILEKGINAQTTKEIESFDFGTLNVYMRLNDLL